MPEEKDSCVKPAGGPLLPKAVQNTEQTIQQKEVQMTLARVGHEAPDFEASAYIASQGFKNIKLSDYRGKWVVMCFYPGDFTFV